MQTLRGMTWLLLLQSMGEVMARGLHLPLPGPVLGMVLLLLALRWPLVQDSVRRWQNFCCNTSRCCLCPWVWA